MHQADIDPPTGLMISESHIFSKKRRGAWGVGAAPLTHRSVGERSERKQDIQNLLAVARLLDVGDLATTAVGNPGLGDLR